MKMTPLSILCRSSGLRQSDLAEILGTSDAWVSAAVTGRTEVNKSQVRNLALALKLPVARVHLAALQTRRDWLKKQAETIAERIRSARQSA